MPAMNGVWGLVSRRSELWFGLLLFIVLALMPLTGSHYLLYLNSQLLCMILAAVSLNLLVGYAGLFSYGHVAYFGLGAYAFAILSRTLNANFGLAFISGPIVAGVLAVIFGYFCVRLTKIYFSMLTLAFAQIVWAVSYKWIALTDR